MKSLNVNEVIRSFNDQPVIGADSKPFTIKDLVLQYVGSYETRKPDEHIGVFVIGQKLWVCEAGQLELEDAEFKLLKKTLEIPKHATAVMAPLLKWLERMEKINEDSSDKKGS